MSTRFNTLDQYIDAGTKAGNARRKGDHGLAGFIYNWYCKAVALEPEDYKSQCIAAFNMAYTEARRAY